MSALVVPYPSIIGAAVSALVGALFACADTALTTLSSARLSALAEQATGPKKVTLERLQRDYVKVRATYVLGRIIATATVVVLFVNIFEEIALKAAPYLTLGATVVLMGTLFEITTSLGRKYADLMAPTLARFLRPLEIAMLPLALPLGLISARIQKNDGSPTSDHRISETEVEIMVDQVERSGLVGKEPAEMIRNVLEFADRTARDVMVPRSKVEAIEVMKPLEQVLRIVTESGHSRYPVYKDQIDNVVGLLYAKDLFKVLEEHRLKNTSLKELMRSPANFVAESQPLSSLLREMRARRQHMAVVVDEFGAASGIVTLEDVLEEIVGDIRDEHDETEEAPPAPSPIEDLGDGRVVADASVSMNELGAYLGAELDVDGGGDESIGGMMTHHAGKVPAVGTSISKYGLQFTVTDSDDARVSKVEISRRTEGDAV